MRSMEMDQNKGEMRTLNQNGRLPVGVTNWYPDIFCASGHYTYAYQILFMCVHVGGGAWIFNIPGAMWSPLVTPGNTFHQISSGGHWQ